MSSQIGRSSSDLTGDMRIVAQKEIERSGLRTPFKSTIDSAYAGGDPKTLRAGEGVVGTDTKKVIAPYACRIPVASEDAVEMPLSTDEAAAGAVVSLSSGVRGIGRFYLLPELKTPESDPATQYGSGVTNNSVRVQRIYIPIHIKVVSVHIEVTTAVASGLAAIGLYSSEATGLNKLVDSGTFDCSGTGVKSNTLGAAVDIDFGWYWYAVTLNDNTMRLRSCQTGTFTALSNAGTIQRGNATNVSSAGVLPSTLGSISGLTFTVMACAKMQG
jgi:hypothetical protein